jgi:hypothetical protein
MGAHDADPKVKGNPGIFLFVFPLESHRENLDPIENQQGRFCQASWIPPRLRDSVVTKTVQDSIRNPRFQRVPDSGPLMRKSDIQRACFAVCASAKA